MVTGIRFRFLSKLGLGFEGTAVFSRQIIQSLSRSTDGSVLVEATVLMPVLVALFFGVFEFSWYFYNQQMTEIGVRDAARYLARGPYFAAPISEGTNPCIDATNKAAAQNLAVTGTIDGSGGARVVGWTIGAVNTSCASFNNTSENYVGPTTIYSVTVSTSFPYPQLGWLGMLGLGIPNLSASHTERSFGSG
jgi:Flp pilus assembly protein TadG